MGYLCATCGGVGGLFETSHAHSDKDSCIAELKAEKAKLKLEVEMVRSLLRRSEQEEAALNLQVREKDEWIKALETRIDTQTSMLAKAGLVELRGHPDYIEKKCDHLWVDYQCEKCGKGMAVPDSDFKTPLCDVQVGCFGQCGKLLPCEDHPEKKDAAFCTCTPGGGGLCAYCRRQDANLG